MRKSFKFTSKALSIQFGLCFAIAATIVFVNRINCQKKMKSFAVLLYFSCLFSVGLMQMAPLKDGLEWNGLKSLLPMPIDPLKLNQVNQTFCTCGVFFSGQFKRGSTEQPKGPPVLMHEQDFQYPCTPLGSKQCSNKCLEVVSSN